jgi:hypothetical protein
MPGSDPQVCPREGLGAGGEPDGGAEGGGRREGRGAGRPRPSAGGRRVRPGELRAQAGRAPVVEWPSSRRSGGAELKAQRILPAGGEVRPGLPARAA